jgi:uncharacterized protein YecE (DUF72 family)
VRLHGARRLYEGAYTAAELRMWADHCRSWARSGAEVFVYFDNDRDAQAAHDAMALHALLEGDESRTVREATPLKRPRRPPSHFGFRRRAG